LRFVGTSIADVELQTVSDLEIAGTLLFRKPEGMKRRRQAELFEEEWDPYAVTPEDALDAARREVKRWRLDQLTHMKANTELDPLTSWFVLAWDAFRAPVFTFDEALRLARAVGVDHRPIRLEEERQRALVGWQIVRGAGRQPTTPIASGTRWSNWLMNSGFRQRISRCGAKTSAKRAF
jgi:hypothetical protein